MSLLHKQIENFSLPDETGNLFELKSLDGKKKLIVFYPGDDTAVCTKQLCSYSSGFEDFVKLGVNIIAINQDSVESHKKFKDKYKLNFPLLSDSEQKVIKAFKANGLLGTKRATYLLDEANKVLFENETLPVFYKDKEEIFSEIKKLC
jgi:thioredoxin-dependent peroxiredoxin